MTESDQKSSESFTHTLIRVFAAQGIVMLVLWLLHAIYN